MSEFVFVVNLDILFAEYTFSSQIVTDQVLTLTWTKYVDFSDCCSSGLTDATCLYHLILSGFFPLRGGVTHNYAKEKFRKKTDLFGPKVVFLSLSLHAKYIYMLKSCCCSRLTTRPPVFNPDLTTARMNVGFCIKNILPKLFCPNCYRFDLSRYPRIYVLHACVWFDFLEECALAAP